MRGESDNSWKFSSKQVTWNFTTGFGKYLEVDIFLEFLLCFRSLNILALILEKSLKNVG